MTWREKIILVVIALAVAVTIGLIEPDPKSREWLAGSSPVPWNQVKDDPAEKMALRWQGIIAHAEGKPGSWIERNLEERFNVDIDPIFMDANTYEKRRPLMLVGGDIPDVMWSGDPIQVRAFLRNGFIMEIPYEVILEHCPTYVAMVNRFGKEAWLYSQYNGRNYGLPTVNAAAARPRISCWRMDWLRNVGIDKVPETLEEMHEAMYRFRHNDPDGNGIKDTYGWFPTTYHWSLAFVEVFAAFDTLPFEFMERDGALVWGGLLPEAKEALRVLQKWYADDIMDPDFVLDTQGRLSESKFINGKVGYTHPVDHPYYYDREEQGSLWGKTLSFDSRAELVPGPPLKNRDGERRGRTWGGAAHIIQFGRHLEKEPEKVIRVLRMMETIASDAELYHAARRGQRGVHWDYNPAEFIKPNGKRQKIGPMLLPPYDGDDMKRQSAEELLGAGCMFFFPSTFEPAYDEALLDPADKAWYDTYARPEWAMMNVLGKSDVVPSSGRYLKDLINYQMTFFIEIVVGDRHVDAFDAFVAEWRRRGGDLILEEANGMYRQVQAIYQRVGVEEVSP